MSKELCEVCIHFEVPKDKAIHIFNARDELAKDGIHFDSGGTTNADGMVELDW